MRNLLSIRQLTPEDVQRLFRLAEAWLAGARRSFPGATCAYSFEGNSLRTRASFLKALAALQVTAIELPNLLKTAEDKAHLAGYLDQWVDVYVVRESNHDVLETFATASAKPVINAMSARAHPCEALGDAFSLLQSRGALQALRVCAVGPTTNVLASWIELCELLDMSHVHVVPPGYASPAGQTTPHLREGLAGADVILTDAWPGGFADERYQVTADLLQGAAHGAVLIPCPPFHIGQEVSADAIASRSFAGYGQKRWLYPVQAAIITALLEPERASQDP